MLDFIKLNLSSILVVLLFIIMLLFLYKRGKKDFVRLIILSLIVQAEKALGSGTGELKYAMVVEGIFRALPPILRFLITTKELDRLIEDGLQYLKNYLSSGRDLLSYDDDYMKIVKLE